MEEEMIRWQQALEHFVRLLPKRRRYVIVADKRFHRSVASDLARTLTASDVKWLDDVTLTEEIRRRRLDENCCLISFLVPDAQNPFSAITRKALEECDVWPEERSKVCFDVADVNFADLFSESPEVVRTRCEALRQKLCGVQSLNVRASEATDLHFDVTGSEWVTYSGFEPFDYILPSGEVACRPGGVSGILDIDGWIVGSLPFGQKYGRVRSGDAVLFIQNGCVTNLSGRNSRLCNDLEYAFSAFSLATIGELGIGQSVAVADLAASVTVGYQWHERHRGVHIGLGAELPEAVAGKDRQTDYHLDVVLESGIITSGETVIERW